MSYSSAALATFDNFLGTLDHLAAKAEKAGLDHALLGEAKLADDMFPLETQFRIAINQVYLALNRLWLTDIALIETPFSGFGEVREAIAAAKSEVAAAGSLEAMSADAVQDMTLPNGMHFRMAAHELLRDWTMPNFYFHATTAYALLRREGLDLGKIDFLGFMQRYAVRPEG
jgi:hypothetical protein